SSMLVTNDVALITFVPLTLVISRKIDINPAYIIVLQTLAANIGSSLTPMGNPQNLFLFTFYRLSAGQFFRVMLPFVLLGALWLAVLNLVVPRKGFELQLNNVEIKDKRKALLFAALFAVIILSIFNVISYILAFILTITAALVAERKLLVKVDFFLLATFVCFFIFIGNLSHIQLVNRYLHYLLSSGNKSFFTSITLSQFISNVPASILTAGFTSCWKEILLGVNIGGMGTLIASLASLISYKLYVNDLGAENSSKYILKFTLYNVVSLLLFTAMNFVLLNLSLI
ncbi:MAG: SLC13 family permease, partial [Bacillota bacterium]|nr:SLC13 family permease [Bacillota bacterium]